MVIIFIVASPSPTFVACPGCRLVESACMCIDVEGEEVAPMPEPEAWIEPLWMGGGFTDEECFLGDEEREDECLTCNDTGEVFDGPDDRPCPDCTGFSSWSEMEAEAAAEARFEAERIGEW